MLEMENSGSSSALELLQGKIYDMDFYKLQMSVFNLEWPKMFIECANMLIESYMDASGNYHCRGGVCSSFCHAFDMAHTLFYQQRWMGGP